MAVGACNMAEAWPGKAGLCGKRGAAWAVMEAFNKIKNRTKASKTGKRCWQRFIKREPVYLKG